MTTAITRVAADDFLIVREKIAVRDIIKENLGAGGAGVRVFDLDRVQIPAAGGLAWQVPSLQGPQAATEIEGVVVLHSDRRVYWKESFGDSGGGTPPDCESLDGVTGVGLIAKTVVGAQCAICPMAQFGSAVSDKGVQKAGQACQQRKLLFMLRQGDVLPLVINLAPTSLGEWQQFALRLASQGIRLSSAVIALGLQQDKSETGVVYSKIKPRLVKVLNDESGAMFRAAGEGINAALSKVPTVQLTSSAKP